MVILLASDVTVECDDLVQILLLFAKKKKSLLLILEWQSKQCPDMLLAVPYVSKNTFVKPIYVPMFTW